MSTGYPEYGKIDLSAIIVIFGGTGDLTHRKLMPAFNNLVYDKLLPEYFAIVSVGRKEKTNEQYRNEVFESIVHETAEPVSLTKNGYGKTLMAFNLLNPKIVRR